MIEKIKKHDWLVRTLKTFLEAFMAVACKSAMIIVQTSSDPAVWAAEAWQMVIVPSLAAAFTAVLNLGIKRFGKE